MFYALFAEAFDLVAYGRLLQRAIRSVQDVLEQPALPDAVAPPRASRLAGVGFSYAGKPALAGVDIAIPAGQLCAFVGRLVRERARRGT